DRLLRRGKVLIGNQQGFSESVELEASATLPLNRLGNTSWVFAVYNAFHAGDYMGIAVLPKLNHDPATAHLLSNRSCSTRACEGIEHPISWLSRKLQHPLKKPFRLWCCKQL